MFDLIVTGFGNIAELLIEKGANVDDQNMNGFSAIHTCASQGQSDILQVNIDIK